MESIQAWLLRLSDYVLDTESENEALLSRLKSLSVEFQYSKKYWAPEIISEQVVGKLITPVMEALLYLSNDVYNVELKAKFNEYVPILKQIKDSCD